MESAETGLANGTPGALATEVIRIAHGLSLDHLGNMERIDALIVDPAAKATRATGGKEQAERPTEGRKGVCSEKNVWD